LQIQFAAGVTNKSHQNECIKTE